MNIGQQRDIEAWLDAHEQGRGMVKPSDDEIAEYAVTMAGIWATMIATGHPAHSTALRIQRIANAMVDISEV